MNLTKSVRELAADINAAAPDNYDSNDVVSEKCLSVEAEFEAAGDLLKTSLSLDLSDHIKDGEKEKGVPGITPSSSDAPYSSCKCPFLHGSVSADFYPGYIHGRNPAICPNNCMPVVDASIGETALQTLLREAREFCHLFHSELGLSSDMELARWSEIEFHVMIYHTYDLTFEELQHGARVAWRNAPKCPNRAKYMELTVADHRHSVTTNEGMFDATLALLDESISSGSTITRMAVFRAKLPGEKLGPRFWNSSALRFAGYKELGENGGILGDPVDAEFTEALINRFGWKAPESKSRFDVLPLLLQINENEPPQHFHIPESYVPIIPIKHPKYPSLAALELCWFGIPVISGMELRYVIVFYDFISVLYLRIKILFFVCFQLALVAYHLPPVHLLDGLPTARLCVTLQTPAATTCYPRSPGRWHWT
jgi:nitric oxide synthase oxygenase domain/subunit